MQETTHYKFKKPEDEDFFDIEHFQDMMDDVDQVLYECEENSKKVVEEARDAAQEVIDSAVTGGVVIDDTAPENTEVLWVDTSVGGVPKTYNDVSETWVPVKSVFG